MNKISNQLWGNVKGQDVYLFKIENASGAYVELSNYGAAIVSIYVPDQYNELGNVVLGFKTLEGYLADDCYIGSTIGRFANRIGGARFTLDGTTYLLEDNDHGNSNHGGRNGFNNSVFDFIIDGDVLSFQYLSRDGEGGYPGNLQCEVRYQWTKNNELIIAYTAVSDQKTVVNLTSHAYFNLGGAEENILGHELFIFSDLIIAADPNYIPTGLIVPAAELTFNSHKIKEKLSIKAGQVSGLNVCYFLGDEYPSVLMPAAVLSEKKTGRVMEVFTTYPGLMLYTGDFLHSKNAGHQGKLYQPFDGLCLECQSLPDSPNHAGFPSTVLLPGETYHHSIVYKFLLKPEYEF